MRTAIVCLSLLAAPAAAQQEPTQDPALADDWRMPFRAPQSNLVPPENLWPHLKPMWDISRKSAPELKHFDERGVEVVEDPSWQRHHDALTQIAMDAGYLSAVIRESRHDVDRAIAFYGAFYVPDPATVINLIGHIPGEPVRAIREDAYVRAIEYLRVHLPARVPGDLEEWQKVRVGPGGQKPPRPGDFAFALDPSPFVALLSVDDPRDQEQALWFLSRLAELRPKLGTLSLDLAKARLRELVNDGNEKVRAAARAFVAILDPLVEGRDTPEDDAAPEAWTAWYDAVLHDVFPPIRRISEGLYDLYPSEDLDELVRVGRRALRDGSLVTGNANGTTNSGAPFRGARIETLPEPLDRLGLEIGFVVTAINGVPTPTADAILRTLERSLPHQRRIFVEYVDPRGENRAIQYRRR